MRVNTPKAGTVRFCRRPGQGSDVTDPSRHCMSKPQFLPLRDGYTIRLIVCANRANIGAAKRSDR